MLSQLHNWILKELIFSCQWFPLKLIFLDYTLFKGYLGSLFICMHNDTLINTQGYTRAYK